MNTRVCKSSQIKNNSTQSYGLLKTFISWKQFFSIVMNNFTSHPDTDNSGDDKYANNIISLRLFAVPKI